MAKVCHWSAYIYDAAILNDHSHVFITLYDYRYQNMHTKCKN